MSIRPCIKRYPGTMWDTMKPIATPRTGTATATSQNNPTSSRRAMMIPPTIMIGAINIMVRLMKTRVCTCITSLVLRVMSEGAPNLAISRLENSPTRWKIFERRVAPEAHRGPGAEIDGDDRAGDLQGEMPSITAPTRMM